ncbi:MAG: hypothetical protein ACO1SV_12405 [Fimbriimonas sp.]
MRRKFEPFDPQIVRREFFSLPEDDATALRVAMKSYQIDLGTGYEVKNYGGGLIMLKDRSRGQGRCLFFRKELVVDAATGEEWERLVVVLVYKKESMEVPARVLDTARARMEGS